MLQWSQTIFRRFLVYLISTNLILKQEKEEKEEKAREKSIQEHSSPLKSQKANILSKLQIKSLF